MDDPRSEPLNASRSADPRLSASDGLLLGARRRDETALAGLYHRYSGLVFTLAHRIVGDRALAEEVMQAVFLRCWHGMEQFDEDRGSIPGWLMGITRNRAIDLLRSRQHQARLGEQEPLPEVGQFEPSTPDGADDVILRETVEQALADLSPSQREAIFSGCDVCQAELPAQQPLGELLARALPPVQPPAGAFDRLLARAR